MCYNRGLQAPTPRGKLISPIGSWLVKTHQGEEIDKWHLKAGTFMAGSR